MENSINEILHQLNSSQIKELIVLFDLEKPHSRSTKADLINHIKQSNASLDAKMLINYFKLQLKQKKEIKRDIPLTDNNMEDTVSNIIDIPSNLNVKKDKKSKRKSSRKK